MSCDKRLSPTGKIPAGESTGLLKSGHGWVTHLTYCIRPPGDCALVYGPREVFFLTLLAFAQPVPGDLVGCPGRA
jgi:hypothetical protein